MKILVAGGAGFIGSHVCETLLKQGHEVSCLDNFVTGSRRNIAALEDYPSFSLIEADVAETPSIKVDMVLHLASPASPIFYRRYPLQTMQANAFGTLRLLELAKENAARFVFASTSEVYGDPLEHPQQEGYWGNVNPVGERSCYDESKRFGETLTYEYGRLGVNASTVRIFNTYGPRMDPHDGRVIPEFIQAALRGAPFPVQGNGQQTRSFCYVSDLVDVLLRIAFTWDIPGEVFNIGVPKEVTVMQIGEVIAGLMGREAEFEFLPPAADDPARRRPDITRVSERFGWQPRTALDEGMRLTIEYFRALQGVTVS